MEKTLEVGDRVIVTLPKIWQPRHRGKIVATLADAYSAFIIAFDDAPADTYLIDKAWVTPAESA